MSDGSSDDYPGMDFSEFTTQDFAQIDFIVASHSSTRFEDNATMAETSKAEIVGVALISPIGKESVELEAINSDVETAPDVVTEGGIADASFQSDAFDLNLSALNDEELARLDRESSGQITKHDGSPSITIEIEELGIKATTSTSNVDKNSYINGTEKPWLPKSPLDEFRSYITLSVTDLVSPAWCEVQYDYGLRGKRHRPISQRPKSFVSSTGKTISPEVTIVKKNDVRTRQGLAVHKELEREIKFEELQVEITTDETRWALRLVNMLACLKSIMSGLTREMPVFGVLHDEVVVGIMDEVIKEEVSSSPNGKKSTKNKRPSNGSHSQSGSKRARIEPPSPQIRIDTFFESPQKTANSVEGKSNEETTISPSQRRVGYIFHIKDNKTRKNHYLPTDPDLYSGRLQLMIYRRLLSELLATNPLYDFAPIWRKVNVDSTATFPTKFLVQAHLIQDSDGFQRTCLDDLVALWHSEVNELNILGVDPNLELVYRLRPPPGTRDKGTKGGEKMKRPQTISDEERDIALAIAASLEGMSGSPGGSVSPSHLVGEMPTTSTEILAASGGTGKPGSDPMFSSEDVELQWAPHETNTPKNPLIASEISNGLPLENRPQILEPQDKGKGKEKEQKQKQEIPEEEEGIRRFKIIGTKRFLHDDEELDRHLDHVLEWWRGERKPEGVPLDLVYRCSTCEYVNDCEWRAQKALELGKKKRSTLP